MTAKTVGSGHEEVVGEVICANRKIRIGFVLPFFGEINSVLPDEGVLGALGNVEACRTYHFGELLVYDLTIVDIEHVFTYRHHTHTLVHLRSLLPSR